MKNIKINSLFILLSVLAIEIHGQTIKSFEFSIQNIKPLPEDQLEYKFTTSKNNKKYQLSLQKENFKSQLTAHNEKTIWLAKNHSMVTVSGFKFISSQAVNEFEFFVNTINNDASGAEQFGYFTIYDAYNKNITKSCTIEWITGKASGDTLSKPEASLLTKENSIISAKDGYCCEAAAGVVRIISKKPFTTIKFNHEVISGTPNGIFISKTIRLKYTEEENTDSTKTLDPDNIKNAEEGEKIRLNHVLFSQGKADLLKESFPQLDTLANILLQIKTMVIEIQGHTDNLGSESKNLQLSKDRVAAVKKYLISKGIAPSRLQEKGFGGTQRISLENSEEGRKKNRRVEFVIVKK